MSVQIIPFPESNCTYAQLADLIRSAFLTVAHDLNLTPENAPTNPAFIQEETLISVIEKGTRFYCAIVNESLLGCIALEVSGDPHILYLERLAVIPEYRHLGLGAQLVDYAAERAKALGAQRLSIGIIEQNTVLKNWYGTLGFSQTALKRFEHLPFTVCFMEKWL